MSRLTRRTFLTSSCSGVAAVALGSSSVLAQGRARQSILPSSRELDRLGLQQAWWSQATLNASLDKLVFLTADEDVVIAQSRSGIVTAIDAETGERLWARLLGTSNAPSFPAATNVHQVLLASGMNMFALDKRTGQQAWQLNLPHHPSTAPAIDDAQAYIGTLDGSAYAFDLRKIRELYLDQKLPDWSNVAVNWRYTAGTELTSPPVSAGRNVSFASLDGSVYTIAQGNGKLTFQFETNGAIRTPLGRNRDSLFIASDDVRFFCIDIENGRLRWTFVPGLPIRKQPQIVRQSVYVNPDRGGLYSLSIDTGFINWHQNRAVDFLTATKDRVYAIDDLGHVLVLSQRDGAIVSTLPMRGMALHVNNDRTDRLFLATETGVVLALKEAGSEFPRYHKFPERQPILPPMGPEEDAGTDLPAVPEEANGAPVEGNGAPVAPDGSAAKARENQPTLTGIRRRIS